MTLVLIAANTQAIDEVKVDKVTSVYDGDTFKVHVTDWPPIVGRNIPIRIKGIDTPEIRGSECKLEKELAVMAKHLTQSMLHQAKTVTLKNVERGKYFRLLADVEVDGVDLAELLKTFQLAIPYDGGKRESWCK